MEMTPNADESFNKKFTNSFRGNVECVNETEGGRAGGGGLAGCIEGIITTKPFRSVIFI